MTTTTRSKKAKAQTTLQKTRIIMIDGELGGIGKSFVARVAVEQCLAAGNKFVLVDADASTPNIGLTYEPELYESFRAVANSEAVTPTLDSLDLDSVNSVLQEQITFTGSRESYLEADKILVLAEKQDVIVVLPSQVAAYVEKWICDSDIAGMLAQPDNTIEFCKLFVTNGSPESLAQFEKSVESSEGKIPHVLVKNHGATTNINWKWFDREGKAAAILNKYGFQAISFPELEIVSEIMTKIISENIPFSEAMAAKWMPRPSKNRINAWLREATMSLAATGLLPYHPNYQRELPEVEEDAAMLQTLDAAEGDRAEDLVVA
jgi:NAD(P)-dependent dehydrogenase (short-subunit alcohol dehydrogenase family)